MAAQKRRSLRKLIERHALVQAIQNFRMDGLQSHRNFKPMRE